MEDYRTEDNPFGLAPGVAVCGPCGLIGGHPMAAEAMRRVEVGEEGEAERPADEKVKIQVHRWLKSGGVPQR